MVCLQVLLRNRQPLPALPGTEQLAGLCYLELVEKKKEKVMQQMVPSGLGPVRGPALTHLLTKAHGTVAEVREALAEIEGMAGEKVVAELERHAAALRELRRALEHLAARTDERFRQQGQDIQALQDAVAGLAGRVAGVEATLTGHTAQLAELKASAEGLHRRLDSLQQQIRDQAAATNRRFEALEQQNRGQAAATDRRFEALQQQIRDLAESTSRRLDWLDRKMTLLLLAVIAALLTALGTLAHDLLQRPTSAAVEPPAALAVPGPIPDDAPVSLAEPPDGNSPED